MNRRSALLSALAISLMAKPAFARPPFILEGDPVPLLSPPFEDGDGRNLMLSDFAGRVVVLNFWATWRPLSRVPAAADEALRASFLICRQNQACVIERHATLRMPVETVFRPEYESNELIDITKRISDEMVRSCRARL